MTTRLAVPLVLFCCSSAALAQVPILSGTFQPVNAGPGDQVDPHVACDLASYTHDDGGPLTIRYFDFNTDTDQQVPTTGASHLSDVNGTRIVYTNVTAAGGSQIAVFDTADDSTLTVPGGNRRVNAAIGSGTVAFEDRSFSTNSNESEIVAHDLGSGVTTRLTSDALMDINPSVSPDGNVVVFQKCQTTGVGCDIYSAVRGASGAFVTVQITGAEGDERSPDTNGALVVYTSQRNGETDVYFRSVTGGDEMQLAIAGMQRAPTISGNLIAFESQMGTQFDIFVYDVVTGNLYQVTSTAGDETLNDVSVCNGAGRIVYSAPGANGDYDVISFDFNPPAPPPPACEEQTPAEACDDPGDRPLLAELSVTRTTGHPDSASADFSSPLEGALVCITNHRATSGAVSINGQRVVGPSAFKHKATRISARKGGLGPSGNALLAEIAGESGTGYEVKVYGEDPACWGCGDGHGYGDGQGGGRDHRLVRPTTRLEGQQMVTIGGTIRMFHDVNAPLVMDMEALGGCSTTTSGAALSALVVLGLWLVSRRRPAAARARRR